MEEDGVFSVPELKKTRRVHREPGEISKLADTSIM